MTGPAPGRRLHDRLRRGHRRLRGGRVDVCLGAPHGVAWAVGAGPTTRTNPTAAADAIDSDTLRRIADM
ncbi:hypothetical protein I550_0735 [Mycobacterium intracellulare 1956]|uniref:Uncharacterized protein n=1 Tax=Mycobacterium intracellulare 1956 TaxID=1299331 RepID=X8CQQ5_MYCIT|nr:hypothetical protein I550_0735 [Mycobacterium intracellulare 1956]